MKNTWVFDKNYAMETINAIVTNFYFFSFSSKDEYLKYLDERISNYKNEIKSIVLMIQHVCNEKIADSQLRIIYDIVSHYFGYKYDRYNDEPLTHYIFTNYLFKDILGKYYIDYKSGSHTKFVILNNRPFGVLSTRDTLKPKVFKRKLLKLRTKSFGFNLFAVYKKPFFSFDGEREDVYDDLLDAVQDLIPTVTNSDYSNTRKNAKSVMSEMQDILSYLNSKKSEIDYGDKLLEIFEIANKMLSLEIENIDNLDDKVIQYDFRCLNFYKDRKRKTIVPYDVWFCS